MTKPPGALLGTRAPLFAGAATALAFTVSPLIGWSGAPGIAAAAASGILLGYFVHARVKDLITRPLRTALGVVEAIKNKDYAHRGRSREARGPAADLLGELNGLSEHLQREHLHALEASALLHAIVSRMDVALLAFDDEGILQWTNAAAQRLFHFRSGARSTAESLGVNDWMGGPPERTVSVPGHAVAACWEMRRGTFWREGRRYVFFLVADSRRVRREHERAAWQRLIRVISHEVNNSLAPIESLSQSCLSMVREDAVLMAPDLERALSVIGQRAGALGRFIGEYARLAKLPPPRLAAVSLAECVHRAVAIERRGPVQVIEGPPIALKADEGQLEQALVNLVRNAVEAALTTGGSTTIAWIFEGDDVVLTVVDEGPGVENPDNLFVPFFSTKPGGSGIGLALSRQIIENHGGELTAANRRDRPGCVARVRLPLASPDELARDREPRDRGSLHPLG